MARVTYVKKAQQRYATIPVLDENGVQKRTPVMSKGVQKTDKHGRPTFLRVTQDDKTRPLPPETCDACRKPIEVGTPYKHISPRSGPYGGRKLSRHASCPSWNVWDYSSSLSARLAQAQHEFGLAVGMADDPDTFRDALGSMAESVREIAEEKRESAQNIEDGFGHETEMSSELNEIADQLDGWADEIEGADVEELPEPDEEDCEECDGSGVVEVESTFTDQDGNFTTTEEECEVCQGAGTVVPEVPSDGQIEEWRDEQISNLSVVDEAPV